MRNGPQRCFNCQRPSGRGHASWHCQFAQPIRLADVVAEVTLADAATFADACEAAKRAQPLWAGIPAPVRGRTVAAMSHIVAANKEYLARLVIRELGKPYPEALGEVQESSTPAISSSAKGGVFADRPSRARCQTSSCSGWRGMD